MPITRQPLTLQSCRYCQAQFPATRAQVCPICRAKLQLVSQRVRYQIEQKIRLKQLHQASYYRCALCQSRASIWAWADYDQPAKALPHCRPCALTLPTPAIKELPALSDDTKIMAQRALGKAWARYQG